MAEHDDAEDKTEEPTAKKRDEARKKGQVARSKELSTMLVTLVAAAMFMMAGDTMLKGVMAVFSEGLTLEREQIFSEKFMLQQLTHLVLQGFLIIIPLLGVCLIAALIAPALIGGWSFSLEAIAFKPEKLNPISGLQKLISMRGMVELVKAIAKFLLVAVIAGMVLMHYMPDLQKLSSMPLHSALASGAAMMVKSFLIVSCSLLIIAALDVPYQLWEHNRQLRMTKQEIKDEYKETEGSPEVKSKVRQMQQEAASRRMMEAVPNADVIVTNPTHYAVALKYDAINMSAPQVVAKGADFIALQIRKLGQHSDVPLLESPALARALYATTEIGEEVPGGLYRAVAQVLTYVYQLKRWEEYGGPYPQMPEPEFDREEFNY